LLTGGEAAVTLTTPQVPDDLGDLHHVTGVQLLEVRLVTPRPVGRLLGVRRAEHVEDAVQTLLVDNVPDAYQVQVAGGHPNDQILLGDDAEYQVLLVLSLDLAGFDVLDDRCPVIWINNRFADGE